MKHANRWVTHTRRPRTPADWDRRPNRSPEPEHFTPAATEPVSTDV